MTRQEKADILKAKAAALIQSLEGRQLPECPFKLKPWLTVFNVQTYYSTNVAIINGGSDPFSRPYVMAYLRLNDLKIYMDEHCKTDSQPGPVQDPAKPGH